MKSIYVILLLCFINVSTFANPIKADTITLENKHLRVKISTLGAEIISVYNKEADFEHLWQADKASWNQHAPILFPIVGKLKNKQYQLDGKTYKMKNHGFAALKQFQVLKKHPKKVVLQLKSNSETLKQYPFQFTLQVTYKLKGSKVSICNKVKNEDEKEMYFSIGGHPGFNIPITTNEKYSDYYLEFNKAEHATRLPLTKKGYLSHQEKNNFLKGNKLPLSHQLFKDRVVILDDLKSSYVTIKSDKSPYGIRIKIKDFNYVGVWCSRKKPNGFVCIEPWYGITDYEDTNGNLKTKKGIQKLLPKKKFLMKYNIKIKKLKP